MNRGRDGETPAARHDAGGWEAEERRLVTVLFADLEGFTARSEQADPEDVARLLEAFHSRARADVERFGGRVEKLLGDGVLAVFGAPRAHEDDPERAVRAALRIQESLAALAESDPDFDLPVRVAVNTGEALVRMEGTHGDREGLIGDVVNTASRLQAVAPVGGVVVGPETYAATRGTVDYEAQDPVRLKGKAAPVPIWVARAIRGRVGVDVGEQDEGPFVGRVAELRALEDVFHRMMTGSLQLVTITGEAGVGKTRLVGELRRYVDELPDLVWWRQGRCLPYGDGITFSALTDIVQAHAGILESDDADTAAEKLEAVVGELLEDPDERAWVVQHLAWLVGAGEGAGDESPDESFGAWVRFIDALTEKHPLVLVVEDLHWADEAQFDFLEHLLDEAFDATLLVICAARTELFDRRPGWGGGMRNSMVLQLPPLDDEQTRELLAGITEDSQLPEADLGIVVELAGGNPLYAGEFVRMVRDREVAKTPSLEALPTPGTLEQLISARLDLVDRPEKELIQGASVVGKVFWPSAVADILEKDPGEVAGGMRALARRQLIQATARSSLAGDREYSFRHALIRDVAYGQIPRRARGAMHLRIAGWIDAHIGDAAPERAELIAHHLSQALELIDPRTAPADLVSQTRDALVEAGRRTRNLSTGRALEHYRAALGHTPDDDAQRAGIMLAVADLLHARNEFEEAESGYLAAIEAFEEAGDDRGKGTALLEYSRLLWNLGRPENEDLVRQGVDILARYPPSPEMARGLGIAASTAWLAGNYEQAVEEANRAIDMATAVEATSEAIRARQIRGDIRVHVGELEEGIEDLEWSLREARRIGNAHLATMAYNNYASEVGVYLSPSQGLQIAVEGAEFGERRGMLANSAWAKLTVAELAYHAGEWELGLQIAEELASVQGGRTASQAGVGTRAWQSAIECARGKFETVATLVDDIVAMTRSVTDVQWAKGLILGPAQMAVHTGDVDGAVALVEEWAARVKGNSLHQYEMLCEATRILIECERPTVAGRLIEGGPDPRQGLAENNFVAARALVAEATGDLETATSLLRTAERAWQELGVPYERAHALTALGRTTAALGDSEAADHALTEALSIGEKLSAAPLVEEVRRLMASLS